jgi:flagellar M-ring protein FliF
VTVLERLRAATAANPGLVRVATGAAVAAVVLALLVALYEPPQRDVFQNASDAERSEIVEVLRTGGIETLIDPATGALTVAAAEFHRAKMLAAAAGLPKAAPGGYDLLEALPLGAPRSVERARLRQAQETELAASIGSIADVAFARVHLAEAAPGDAPSASVMVSLRPGRRLSDGQVAAIRHLVAFSTAALAVARVSVVDQSGALLSDGAAGDADARTALRLRLEAEAREQVRSLLAPVLGAGNFSAVATVTLSNVVRDATRERYDPAASAVRSEQRDRSGAATLPRGVPGAVSNLPPPAATVSAQPGDETPAPEAAGNERLVRNYELARDVEVTRETAPAVARLTVSVAIREGTAPSNMPQLERLIGDAVGLDPARGDRLSVSVQPFAEVTAPPPAPWWEDGRLLPMLQALLLGAGALVAGVLVARAVGRLQRPAMVSAEADEGVPLLLPRERLRTAIEADPDRARRAVRAMLSAPVR